MPSNPVPESTDRVVDPVCGMTISPDRAAGKTEYAGQTSYDFCATRCLERFRAEPERFVGMRPVEQPVTVSFQRQPPRTADADGRSGVEYTCPMDPEVRQRGPGACPKCGMALEPVLPTAPTKSRWTCPMHPEIVRDGPGSCPICGMALEPRTVTLEEEENPELVDMTRRFWVSAVLSLPVVRHGDERFSTRPAAGTTHVARNAWLDSTRDDHSGRALGRMAIFCARLAIRR